MDVNEMDSIPHSFSPQFVAQYLNISNSSAYRLAKCGLGVQIGARIVIFRDDFFKYLEDNRIKPISVPSSNKKKSQQSEPIQRKSA